VFLGDNLLPYLVLALGGALVVGNGLALLRPRSSADENDLARPPLVRTLLMMLVGLVATVWALATLTS
jgi:hypothetical protein